MFESFILCTILFPNPFSIRHVKKFQRLVFAQAILLNSFECNPWCISAYGWCMIWVCMYAFHNVQLGLNQLIA